MSSLRLTWTRHGHSTATATPVFIPGALQHVAFALPDAAAAGALRERLRAHGIERWPTGLGGPVDSMLFFDNNGSMLEATWPRSETR